MMDHSNVMVSRAAASYVILYVFPYGIELCSFGPSGPSKLRAKYWYKRYIAFIL